MLSGRPERCRGRPERQRTRRSISEPRPLRPVAPQREAVLLCVVPLRCSSNRSSSQVLCRAKCYTGEARKRLKWRPLHRRSAARTVGVMISGVRSSGFSATTSCCWCAGFRIVAAHVASASMDASPVRSGGRQTLDPLRRHELLQDDRGATPVEESSGTGYRLFGGIAANGRLGSRLATGGQASWAEIDAAWRASGSVGEDETVLGCTSNAPEDAAAREIAVETCLRSATRPDDGAAARGTPWGAPRTAFRRGRGEVRSASIPGQYSSGSQRSTARSRTYR